MIKRSFFLLSTATFFFWGVNGSIASSSFNTHTQHTPMELKPTFLNPQGSFQIASVCFLGVGDCGEIGFNKGDDYGIDSANQCKNEGFIYTSCTLPAYLEVQCPYNSNYYAKCTVDNDRACKESGYDNSCDDGYVKDNSKICPYDASYYKCKCNPCDGYTYTYEQATAEGYVADGSCISCGTTKYKRKENSCGGYTTCECGGEIGETPCYSGTVRKYKKCKECCTPCASGTYSSCDNNYYAEITGKDGCGNLCYQCYKGRIHIYGYWGATSYCYPNCYIPNYSYVRYVSEHKYCEYKNGSQKYLGSDESEGCFASIASNCNDEEVGGNWDEYSGYCN